MHAALTAALLAALALAASATAAPPGPRSEVIGGDRGAAHAFAVSCPDGHVLTGLELQYNSNLIGQVRGLCRPRAGGRWADAPRTTTGWSTVAPSNAFPTTRKLECPQDYAIAGLRGRSAQTPNGFQVRALRLRCRALGDAGATWGPVFEPEWIGGSGDSGPARDCPTERAAIGVSGHSRRFLHGVQLLCDAPPAEP